MPGTAQGPSLKRSPSIMSPDGSDVTAPVPCPQIYCQSVAHCIIFRFFGTKTSNIVALADCYLHIINTTTIFNMFYAINIQQLSPQHYSVRLEKDFQLRPSGCQEPLSRFSDTESPPSPLHPAPRRWTLFSFLSDEVIIAQGRGGDSDYQGYQHSPGGRPGPRCSRCTR